LSKNGHAIYGTRPWKISDARTGCGLDVRFTTSGGDLHVILLGTPSAEELVLKDVILAEKPGRMNDGAPVTVERRGNDSVLRLHSVLPDAAAHALTFALPDPDMD
jgi:alpha-L-fucosidase